MWRARQRAGMLHFLRVNLWTVVVVALAITALVVFVDPAPPDELTIATGVEGGGYDAFGRRLAERLAQDGMKVALRPTAGSAENLALLRDPDGDIGIALVQSGLAPREDPGDLRLLGSLFYEPLWLFHRADFEPDSVRDLQGRAVAIGAPGSGTHAVARMILEAHGADADAFLAIGGAEAVTALQEGRVDAAFFVAAPGSPQVRELVADPGVRLMDMRRRRALQAHFPQLTTLVVGQGQLDLAADLPASDRGLLASVATLVVNDRFHPGLTPLVLNAANDILRQGGLLERPGEFPADRPGDFPLSREAGHYHNYGLPFLMRFLPFWAASLFDRVIILLIPLLALLIPVFRAAPPLYRWRTRRKIFTWYRHLREIDRRIEAGTIAATIDEDLKRLHALQDETSRVDVPLSYADELYALHLHIEWVVRRLEALRAKARGDATA